MAQSFSEGALFQYNRSEKLRFAFLTYGSLLVIGLVLGSYFLFLRHEGYAFFEFFARIIGHVSAEIASTSALGMVYAALFGGLFFVTIPMEIVFVSFLRNGASPFFLILAFIGGFFVSFSINYFIGMKLDNLSRRIISPQKFYKIKGVLNRRGAAAVFAINAIPFFPSQPLSTVLGVFRYNRTKFYVYFIAGQFLKFGAIAIAYIYIVGVPGGGI